MKTKNLNEKSKKTFKLIKKLIEIMKKSMAIHLTIYGIMIALLISLAILNKPFTLLEVNFSIPTCFIVTLLITMIVALFVIVILEVFSKEEYDEKIYYKIAKGIWHLFFMAVSLLILSTISMIAIYYLSKISSFYLSIVLVLIITILSLSKINNFSKKKGIQIYNPLSWVNTIK